MKEILQPASLEKKIHGESIEEQWELGAGWRSGIKAAGDAPNGVLLLSRLELFVF